MAIWEGMRDRVPGVVNVGSSVWMVEGEDLLSVRWGLKMLQIVIGLESAKAQEQHEQEQLLRIDNLRCQKPNAGSSEDLCRLA